MKKAVISLALIMLILFSGCSGNQDVTESEQPMISPSDTFKPQETNTPSATPDGWNEITQNQIQFDMDLEAGKMNVTADYIISDTNGCIFLLNRDFVVTTILCDGQEVSVDNIMETVYLDDEYEVKQYNLPSFEETVHIEYTGTLSGKTGQSPYVRETISPEFTFLRFETFCHPLFANAENYWDTLNSPFSLQVTVNMPSGYMAQFTSEDAEQKNTYNGASFMAFGNLPYWQIAVAIAKYQKIETEACDYYFLENTKLDNFSTVIDSTMARAHEFMNQHFGKREFQKKLRVIEILSNLGSFAIPETHMTFVQGSSFKSVSNMTELIHEFTHTGWNAKVEDPLVQRSRFFDEAFAMYFQSRVMADILGYDVANVYGGKNFIKNATAGYDIVPPIKDFGKYGYGGLSYSIGALCLYKLSELVGVEVFDKATTAFLQKYKDTPVDFDLFCAEYIERCDNPEVEAFFQKWIYSDEYKNDIE